MNWKTYPMGGSGWEKAQRFKREAHLSHAVDVDKWKPLCNSVKIDSLCMDDSLATKEMPDCQRCVSKLKRILKLP